MPARRAPRSDGGGASATAPASSKHGRVAASRLSTSPWKCLLAQSAGEHRREQGEREQRPVAGDLAGHARSRRSRAWRWSRRTRRAWRGRSGRRGAGRAAPPAGRPPRRRCRSRSTTNPAEPGRRRADVDRRRHHARPRRRAASTDADDDREVVGARLGHDDQADTVPGTAPSSIHGSARRSSRVVLAERGHAADRPAPTSTRVTGSASGSTSAMNGAARRFSPKPIVPCTSARQHHEPRRRLARRRRATERRRATSSRSTGATT